jgi:hypothetical protein
MIIPVHDYAPTLAQFLTIYGENNIAKRGITDWPINTPFEVVPFTGIAEADTNLFWPFMDDAASITDLFTTLFHYRRRCFLPHPYTGLSAIQTFVLSMNVANIKTQAFLAAGQFNFPSAVMYDHCLQLTNRNVVVTSKESYKLPLLLCNGPYPYNPDDLKDILLRRIQGQSVDYETLRMWYKDSYDPWNVIQENGVITRLPYGQSAENYPDHVDESSWNETRLLGPRVANVGAPTTTCWECFDGKQYQSFHSVSEYMSYWFQTRLNDLVKKISDDALHADFVMRRKDFIRKLFVQTKESDGEGGFKRYYIDLCKEDKQRLLMRDYGTDEFAQTPVCEIGPDFDDDEEPIKFITARDLMKLQLIT